MKEERERRSKSGGCTYSVWRIARRKCNRQHSRRRWVSEPLSQKEIVRPKSNKDSLHKQQVYEVRAVGKVGRMPTYLNLPWLQRTTSIESWRLVWHCCRHSVSQSDAKGTKGPYWLYVSGKPTPYFLPLNYLRYSSRTSFGKFGWKLWSEWSEKNDMAAPRYTSPDDLEVHWSIGILDPPGNLGED